ncbi:nitroreductase family protein [Micromonospora sp. WMMD882]|uniref:nitroreductase family protein n=1 Tax=Micromonospora sp. WMMD882 TaxID=3015151 RepID=UPI00248BA6E8|nr:nitroreductase family protein [Micromonospora sp. WMMD882]WBB81899.1 nitroreductase family protein [Micromonospora sp. WMMD882]
MNGSMHVMSTGPSVQDGTREATATGPVGPTADVARFWDRMLVFAASADEAEPAPITVPAELTPVLRLFESAGVGSPTGGCSAPSAGALYPYEHYAVVTGADGPAVYALDAVRRNCQLTRVGAPVAQAVEDAGLTVPAAGEALVLTVARPWLSMRKYGNRGYLYTQFDTAHLAVHLLCLATESCDRAELRTHLPDSGLASLLNLGATCRFLHSVLVLGARRPDAPQVEADTWSCVDGRKAGSGDKPSFWLEAECWRSVDAYRPRRRPTAGRPVRTRPLLPEVAAAPPTDLTTEAEPLTTLAARRRSAKDFAATPLARSALARTLAALRTPLATDLGHDTGLSATLVARRVTGCPPGSYPLHGAGPWADHRTTPPDDDELVRVCMGQYHLRHAAAVVLLHAPRAELVRSGPPGLDTVLLRAGALAHLLYLGAAEARIGVTAIGGFDAGRWRALAGIPAAHEVLYAVLLGNPGPAAVKLDRLHPAYAHNER